MAGTSRGNDVVAEMRAVLTEVVPDETTAARAAAALGAHFAGCQIYFPLRGAARAEQAKNMRAAGAGHNEICRALRISRTTLYRLLGGAE